VEKLINETKISSIDVSRTVDYVLPYYQKSNFRRQTHWRSYEGLEQGLAPKNIPY